MRKKSYIIVLCMLIFSIKAIYSQDHNIGQLSVMYYGTPTFLDNTIVGPAGPGEIIRGYQWGNENSVSKAIYANQNSVKMEYLFIPYSDPPIADPTQAPDGAYLLISNPQFWSGTLNNVSLMHSHSMTFEPNMEITTGDNQYSIIKKRPFDLSHPVFGFTQIHSLAEVPTNSTDPNYSFLLIKNTNLIGEKVFSDPWGSEFLWRSDVSIDIGNLDQQNYQGYSYCVSINLKRLNEEFPPSADDAEVLEIKLPYTRHDNVCDYIVFDSIPGLPVVPIESSCSEVRGKKTTLVYLANPEPSFIITKDMLPADFSTVTITAHFKCWGINNLDPFKNPLLSTPTSKNDPDIRKLGCEVFFKGGCPIAVDYVRICTPYSVKLFEGEMDSEIRDVIQSDINNVASYNAQTGKGVKIHRFNASSEGSVQNFDVEHYINKLMGNVFATTNTPMFPVLFDYYVQPPNRMLNCAFVGTCINAPYITVGERRLDYRYRTLGLIAGRAQKNTYDQPLLTTEEQLNSGYETFYPFRKVGNGHYHSSDYTGPTISDDALYSLGWTDGSDSPSRAFQAYYQFNVWHNFYNDSLSGFQYLDTPWYFQTQNLTWWERIEHRVHKDSLALFDANYIDINQPGLQYSIDGDFRKFSSTQINSFGRPFTAEETRVLTFCGLTNGAKGLIIDGVSYYGEDRFTRMAHKTALINNPLSTTDTYLDYLNREEYGSDYFDFDSESILGTNFIFPILRH